MMLVSSRLKDTNISKILEAVEGMSIKDIELSFYLALITAKKAARFETAHVEPETSEVCSA